MPTATVTTLTLAAAGAPLWIAGWIIVLALVIGLPVYVARRRRQTDRPRR